MPSARTLTRTLRSAAAFVDRSGVALVFPKEDVVLLSLWEAVAGPRPVEWAVRDEDGSFVSFTPEMDRVWAWKDELPGRGFTAAGKHVAGRVSLVSFGLIGSLYALTGRPGRPEDFRSVEDLSPLERDVAEAVLQEGVSTAPELHRALETPDRKRVKAAVESLERMLVLTRAGSREQDRGWPAGAFDLLARRCSVHLVDLPSPEDARRRIRRQAPELRPGALRCRRHGRVGVAEGPGHPGARGPGGRGGGFDPGRGGVPAVDGPGPRLVICRPHSEVVPRADLSR